MPKSKKSEKANQEPVFEVGSGNIFVDLGFTEEEAANLLIRSNLMMILKDTIKNRCWTQQRAAKELGVSQSRISDLFTGRIHKFSVDMLMKWLDRIGKEIVISVKDKTQVA
jgi:predicted XRE-type DNA-binding protein